MPSILYAKQSSSYQILSTPPVNRTMARSNSAPAAGSRAIPTLHTVTKQTSLTDLNRIRMIPAMPTLIWNPNHTLDQPTQIFDPRIARMAIQAQEGTNLPTRLDLFIANIFPVTQVPGDQQHQGNTSSDTDPDVPALAGSPNRSYVTSTRTPSAESALPELDGT